VTGQIVVPRAAFDELGGWDERFEQWGGEDAAFCYALDTLRSIDHVAGTAVTIEHERTSDEMPATEAQFAWRNPAGDALVKRYYAAWKAKDQDAMRAILVR
jgi:hypothetical protein